VPVYCSGGSFSAAHDHHAAVARQLEPYVQSGFPVLELTLGRPPDEDIVRAWFARRIIGDAALLMADVKE
jgi:L-alanine-DL-glutamate epimerase-like enolase superfamily enzyme